VSTSNKAAKLGENVAEGEDGGTQNLVPPSLVKGGRSTRSRASAFTKPIDPPVEAINSVVGDGESSK
jgi:hypothetical protein